MTDVDDLLARADANSADNMRRGPLVRDLAGALRAERAARQGAERDRDAYKALYDDLHEATGFVDGYDVGTAERSVIRRLLDGWRIAPRGMAPPVWTKHGGLTAHHLVEEPMSDAERAVLAAIEEDKPGD